MSDQELTSQAAGWVKEAMLLGLSNPDTIMDTPEARENVLGELTESWPRLMEKKEHKLRLSYGSRCARRLWYTHHKPEAASAVGPERVTFSMGDLWEVIAFWAVYGGLKHMNSKLQLDPESNQREVDLLGIKGHIDGLLTYEGEPTFLLDFKQTSKWVHRKWIQGRVPDPIWGYPMQAANYIEAMRSEGCDLKGFIWAAHLKDVGGYETGWATTEELAPYLKESATNLARALMDTPPARAGAHPHGTPCRGKARIYCPFYETCSNDS